MKKFFLSLGIALVGAMSFVSAQAAPTFCSPGPNADGLAVTDVSVNGIDASNCYGVVMGNDDASAINAIGWGSFGLAARDNIGSDPDVSNTLNGISWSLTADPGTAGDFVLSGVDTNGALPANLGDTFDLVFVVKASDRYSAYLFSGISLFGSNAGEYAVSYLNNGEQVPKLSHGTAYLRYVGGDVPNPVPEPSTYALTLAGLGLVGVISRRKLNKQ